MTRDGPVPALPSPAPAAQPLAHLLEDQRQRWRGGQPLPVETYLEQHAALREDVEAVLDLVCNEFLLRQESECPPEPAEYLRRFPDLAERLRLLFEVDRALERSQALAGAASRLEPV